MVTLDVNNLKVHAIKDIRNNAVPLLVWIRNDFRFYVVEKLIWLEFYCHFFIIKSDECKDIIRAYLWM